MDGEVQTMSTERGDTDQSMVSVCGIGAVTGYGWGQKLLREGLYSGQSAVRPTPGYGSHLPDDLAWVAPVEDGGDPDDGPTRFARATRFAAREAVHNAVDRGWRPGAVVGVIHGFVLGDVDGWRSYHHRHGRDATRREWLSLMPSTVLSEINREFDFHGPTMGVTAMCASGVSGLLTAKLWIDTGLCTDVLVVCSDLSLSPENCAAFGRLGVLVTDQPPNVVCRPFQEGTTGFNCGEAAVAMIVSGRPDGAYAVVRGGAMTNDGFHPVSIAPDHAEVFRAFHLALDAARVHPTEIAYLNAHATGTLQCDEAERRVLDELLVAAEGVFSLKPLTGHCQGAAGAVELLGSLYGFQTGVIPAPYRVAPGHPRLLDGPTACVEGPVAKSSLGMGGNNAVVVLDAPAA